MGLFGIGGKKAKDPVCGMDVDPRKAEGTGHHEGKSYYFCSVACEQEFKAHPQQYAD